MKAQFYNAWNINAQLDNLTQPNPTMGWVENFSTQQS